MLLLTELILHQNPQRVVFRLPPVTTVSRPADVTNHKAVINLCHMVFQVLVHSLAQKLEITASVVDMLLFD
jgi:hypothetical protein